MIKKVFDYNQHFVAMMNVINAARLNPPERGHKHHIIPKCYYRMHNVEVDNSESNLVLLSATDHQLVHKLAVLCVKDPILRSKMGFAVHILGGSMTGMHHTEHAKELLRKAAMGNKNCLGKKLSEAHKGQIAWNKGMPTTEFGRKFFDKFNLCYSDNTQLYSYHYNWYKKHNNICKWEVK